MLKNLKKFKAQSVGVGTKFLKLGMIKNMEIALPAVHEQEQLASKMDVLLEETERLESIYQQKLEALAELKQSILQKAFAGELTAQPEKVLQEAAA
jgi:type I restriction enzyme S subunit